MPRADKPAKDSGDEGKGSKPETVVETPQRGLQNDEPTNRASRRKEQCVRGGTTDSSITWAYPQQRRRLGATKDGIGSETIVLKGLTGYRITIW
jgi:hypothetical protein